MPSSLFGVQTDIPRILPRESAPIGKNDFAGMYDRYQPDEVSPTVSRCGLTRFR
jgi:hypothetical protein